MKWIVAAIAYLCAAMQAFAIDTAITLSVSSDIAPRRAALINNAWGVSTGLLPATQPTITTGISNPFPSYAVSRVDQYVASMSNGQTNTSNLYNASSPNGKVVILNPGHQNTCDWTAFDPNYRVQLVLQALLAAGYSVFAMNMPGCGMASVHVALFSSYHDPAMQYFFEPLTQAVNYWVANSTFTTFTFLGFSGGGWTSTAYSAIDPRIRVSFEVEGSEPGVQFVTGYPPNHGDGDFADSEQNHFNYYTIAGFLDQYIMASFGLNRAHYQISNLHDNCCYGPPQWVTPNFDFQAYYGLPWLTYTVNYVQAIQALPPAIQPMNFVWFLDTVATQHQISTSAQAFVLNTLDVLPGSSGAGRGLLGRR